MYLVFMSVNGLVIMYHLIALEAPSVTEYDASLWSFKIRSACNWKSDFLDGRPTLKHPWKIVNGSYPVRADVVHSGLHKR